MINRRQLLKYTSAGAMGVFSAGVTSFFPIPQANAEAKPDSAFNPDLDISLTAAPTEIPLYSGHPTSVWSFRGKVLKGKSEQLVNLKDSYLGPIIRVNRGQKIRIRFTNEIRHESIVHWHGLHVPADMDGHPRYVILQGETFVYEFEIRNRAGTYWYHPHPHGNTGSQVYGGMAGLFIVSDDEEKAAGLPAEEFDIPLVIQDRTFDRNNQLIYLTHHMDRVNGFLGDRILVNGRPDFKLPVATRAYRFRLLNGSNSRIYRLAWQDNSPLTIIGTDGGLLEKPVLKQYVLLAPGERIDLWADFSKYPVGSETSLVSLPFYNGMPGDGITGRRGMRGGRMHSGRARATDSGFPLVKVQVDKKVESKLILPNQLSSIERYRTSDVVNLQHPRTFRLLMRHMNGTFNGRTFRMEEVAEDEKVKLDTLEVWEFINDGGGRGMGMMGNMNMPHPIHLHGKQFQVLERNGVSHKGYVDEGWKDTVLLMPGERIKILVRFEDYSGLFLYHCHNLEHEDMGMMRNYMVV